MKPKRLLIAVLLLLAVVGGFIWRTSDKERQFLMNSDEFVLCSLEPDGLCGDCDAIGGHKVLGEAVITDRVERAALVNALFSSFGDFPEAACHSPRHGIRAKRGNTLMEISICFECHNTYFSIPGNRLFRKERLDDRAKALFNQTLLKHHLPLVSDSWGSVFVPTIGEADF